MRTAASSDIEREFNPRATVPDFQLHLDRSKSASDRARASLRCQRDMRYGPGPRQCVDFYPAASVPAPCLVYVHGGFWRALSKEQSSGIALSFVPKGVHCALVGYDLCPEVSLDAIVTEIRQALRWCCAVLPTLGAEPAAIHLCGVSAGAHLIASALLEDGDPPGFASAWLLSGIYELEPVLAISVNEVLGLDAAAAARNSPLRHLRKLATPLHIRVGSAESEGWIAQSAQFARAARDAGCDVDFQLLAGANHFTLGLSDPQSALVDEMLAQVAPRA